LKTKFPGKYGHLKDLIMLTGNRGIWHDFRTRKRYRTDNGAVLNWWESTKTITFQGPELAAKELETAFLEEMQDINDAKVGVTTVEQDLGKENAELKRLLGGRVLEIAMLKKRESCV
jgi:hypothetical protein